MRNWKTFLIICFTFIFIPVYGQGGQSEQLAQLLNNGKYFEAKELYQSISNIIDFDTDLYYKFKMAIFMNRKDSVAIYTEKMLADYPELTGSQTIDFYAMLFDTYISLKNYEKGMYTYLRMKEHLEENPYDMGKDDLISWKNNLENFLSRLKSLSSQPPITLRRNKTKKSIKIKENTQLAFEATFNGMPQQAMFDTGFNAAYCVLNRGTAEKMGLSYDTSKTETGTLNNMEMPVIQTIIDSIEIGNILLYHVPTIIYEYDITPLLPDSIKNDSVEMERFKSAKNPLTNPILGLPLMQLIGKIQIDYKNKKISFPNPDRHVDATKTPNLFVWYNMLYAHLKLNGQDFTGQLDSGDLVYLDIDSMFYDRHREYIPIDTVTQKEPYNFAMIHQVKTNIPYQIPDKPIIVFENKQMQIPAESTPKILSIRSIWPVETFDGVIGYEFFRRIGKKILLDLDNMRLEIIK